MRNKKGQFIKSSRPLKGFQKGNKPWNSLDLTGKKFNKLTVIKRNGYKRKQIIWLCKCDCGKEKNIRGICLTQNTTRSCGCLMKEINKGYKNGNWLGEKIGYGGVHQWINNNYKKPELCQICKKVPPYDLANINPFKNKETYTRDIKNWEWLCRRCHMIKDGRMKKLYSGIKN